MTSTAKLTSYDLVARGCVELRQAGGTMVRRCDRSRCVANCADRSASLRKQRAAIRAGVVKVQMRWDLLYPPRPGYGLALNPLASLLYLALAELFSSTLYFG